MKRLSATAWLFMAAAPAALAAGLMAPTERAYAQSQSAAQAPATGTDDQAIQLEEIMVTGSFIRREGYNNPSPLEVIDRSDMGAQGATNITDIVKNVAVNTGSEFNFDRTNQNFTFGTAQFNLRGLGLGSTLTLINGRRITRSAAVANDGSQFVDVNSLPMNMIERMEILKDGASALYGTDAVAGVVNIITRSNFEGFELEGRYQTTTENSQEDINLNAAFGAGNDRSHISAFFTYFDRTDLRGIDRDFFPNRLSPETDTGQGMPGTFFPAISDGNGGFIQAPGAPGQPAGSLAVPPPSRQTGTGPVPDPRCLDQTGLPDASGLKIIGPGADTRAGIGVGANVGVLGPDVRGFCAFNFAENFSIVPDERRVLFFTEARHKLNDRLELFAEFNYADNRSTVDASPSLPNQFEAILVPANNPFIPTVEELGGINPVFHNPDGSPRAVFAQFRVKNLIDGSGQMQVDSETWRAMAGLRFDLSDNWFGEVHYQRSENEVSFTDNAATVFSFTEDALAGTLRGFEGQFLNPFASEIFDRPTDQALEDAVMRTSERFTKAEQTTVEGFVSGTIESLQLPGGSVGVAFGGSYRKNTFLLDNDGLLEIGDSFFQPPSPDGSGDIDVYGFFGEISLPVTSRIELSAAVRYEDYGSAIGDTIDPKISARWQATDWAALRASFGTSFRAPNVSQTAIFETGTQRLNDPFLPGPGGLSCDANNDNAINVAGGETRPINTAFGKVGNPDLTPEESTNFNVGFVIEPPRSNVRISVDYWNYDVDDVILLEDNQAIAFNDCLDDGIANDPRITRTASGTIIDVSRAFFNGASLETDGVDLNVSYDLAMGRFGDLNASAVVSWINSFDIDLGAFGSGEVIDGVGSRNRTNPFRSVPEWRANFPVNWFYKNHNLNITARIVDGVFDDQSLVQVDAETTFDVQYQYRLDGLLSAEDAITLTVGAVNVFDNEVPVIPGETFRFDSKLHDPRQRMLYVRLKFEG
ncbi:TonB-dependent receptor [Iodidimonas nitroreducens]|uniref:TonB-dependent receptor n=1 Tax=Iodidimonas nitroreducens TaxID=1236968 RepID=A0A5A7N9Z4_9PROT|nr:TonB-dependent receptor [Iodidimonas nitroreducens]GAK34298.1 colicin I receptor [alpha proteobacterium Q-1]GER04757.1 TonB-dependent receptor [Iodidimonas nitroreducens]